MSFVIICCYFQGDVKKEIHLWLEDNDFKALLYFQGELWGTMFDFDLEFVLWLEKFTTQNVIMLYTMTLANE